MKRQITEIARRKAAHADRYPGTDIDAPYSELPPGWSVLTTAERVMNTPTPYFARIIEMENRYNIFM